jgi:hypothetical protein
MNTLNDIEINDVSGGTGIDPLTIVGGFVAGVAAAYAWLYTAGYQAGADAAARDNVLACPAPTGP